MFQDRICIYFTIWHFLVFYIRKIFIGIESIYHIFINMDFYTIFFWWIEIKEMRPYDNAKTVFISDSIVSGEKRIFWWCNSACIIIHFTIIIMFRFCIMLSIFIIAVPVHDPYQIK